jgi:predicted outer membrane repeat protein
MFAIEIRKFGRIMEKSILILSLLIMAVCGYATIINIPEDYPTIQEGLNVAEEGDSVLVAPGIYYENIIWPETNEIKLIGNDEENCIIDGYQNGSVICFENHVDSATLVSKFTITNGSASHGGGILCVGSPCLENLMISGNNANCGGGIYCTKSAEPIITEVAISNNTASEYGGGLYCYEGGYPTLIDVTITENTAGEGAGLGCGRDSSISLIRTLISDNSAIGGYSSSGGILCGSNSIISLMNVTITNNSAEIVGGIYCDSSSNMNLTNCIVWNNAGFEIYVTYGSVIVTYSDIQGGWEGEGNIDADPLFTNPTYGDYHLTENSPCIDAGDPMSPYDPDGTIADMGAFYYNQGTGIEENYELQIMNYSLSNFPNPFNPTTTISFSISEESNVELSIFNMKGQKIITLFKELLPIGNHSVIWDGDNDSGNLVSSGIYLYKLKVNGKTEAVKKCLLLK